MVHSYDVFFPSTETFTVPLPRLRKVQGAAHRRQCLTPVGRFPHRRNQRQVHRRQAPRGRRRRGSQPAELLGAKTQQLGGQTWDRGNGTMISPGGDVI